MQRVGEGRLRGDVRAARRAVAAREPEDLLPRRLPARQSLRDGREGHDRARRAAVERWSRACPGERRDRRLRRAQGDDDLQGDRDRGRRHARRLVARAAAPGPAQGRGGPSQERPGARPRQHLRRRAQAVELRSAGRLDRGRRGQEADRPGAHLRRPPRRRPQLDAALRGPRDRPREGPQGTVDHDHHPARSATHRAERAGRAARRDRGDQARRRLGARARRARRLRAPAARLELQGHHRRGGAPARRREDDQRLSRPHGRDALRRQAPQRG